MSIGSDFKALVDDSATQYGDIRSFLEKLTPVQRRLAIIAIRGKHRHGRLFELAGDGPDIAVSDLIAEDERGALEPVIFHGKNSLFAFTIFQKRFCRSGTPDELLGYNHQTFAWVTGPGYFVVRESRDEERELGTVAVDYTRLPDEKPGAWPAIKPNERGLSSLVYGNMIDYLRPLADDVFIGRAVKKGKLTDNYFLLAREALAAP